MATAREIAAKLRAEQKDRLQRETTLVVAVVTAGEAVAKAQDTLSAARARQGESVHAAIAAGVTAERLASLTGLSAASIRKIAREGKPPAAKKSSKADTVDVRDESTSIVTK